MAIQSLDTTFKTPGNRMADGSYFFEGAAAAASTVTVNIIAPVTGKLKAAMFSNGATTMSATNNYAISAVNKSNSDAAMLDTTANGVNDFGGTTYTGAFLAAYAKGACALHATAANLNVTRGDTIAVTFTVEGTVTTGAVKFAFEAID